MCCCSLIQLPSSGGKGAQEALRLRGLHRGMQHLAALLRAGYIALCALFNLF